ncbi:MAG: hypothetical protein PHV29_03225, partial [Candidatus Pacebacteria bacterium]|nr:hypothetical protein [Candidatus Paceibacterota bacterium]
MQRSCWGPIHCHSVLSKWTKQSDKNRNSWSTTTNNKRLIKTNIKTNMSTKKFGIVAGLVFALSIVLSPAASACSLQDLSSCDNDGLMALIVQMLAGQTTTTTTTTTPTITGIPAGFQFNTNLKLGSTGDDVKYLQILLNTSADHAIGNAGKET